MVALRSDRRRREIALLRLRGASASAVLRVVAAESLAVAVLGAALGVPLAMLAVRLALPAATPLSGPWTLAAILAGVALALTTHTGSVIRLALGRERSGVAAEASRGERSGTPWPLKAGLDLILLAGAAISFALTARAGYQVVLAPEGIPQTQVDYAALAGPALAWPGLALLVSLIDGARARGLREYSLQTTLAGSTSPPSRPAAGMSPGCGTWPPAGRCARLRATGCA